MESLGVTAAPAARASMAGGDAWARTSVVAVTHDSSHVIGPCLASVARATAIVVVDNASRDGCVAAVRANAPAAELIANPVGLGYGNGANQGLERVASEFALVINPDAVLRAGALDALIAAADAYPDAAMLGPAIYNPDGSLEISHDTGLFERARLDARRDGEPAPEGPLCAGFLSGAVFVLRMSAVRATGGYDPAIFLYYEDDDLCLRLRAAGYSLVLVPGAQAEHLGGGSIHAGWASHWEKFFHMAWSRLYVEAKHGRAGGGPAVALGNALGFAAKALGYALIGQATKAVRDAARASGSLAYLLGRPASRSTRRARPKSSAP
jgi:N-acetylglucosaminyl-diphospho-decaprenol L-rhamnosyltransferase